MRRLIGLAVLLALMLPVTLSSLAEFGVVRAASCSTQTASTAGAGLTIPLPINAGDNVSVTAFPD